MSVQLILLLAILFLFLINIGMFLLFYFYLHGKSKLSSIFKENKTYSNKRFFENQQQTKNKKLKKFILELTKQNLSD
tara:strand:- start:132 stop:362 length:231 start_codon:yes stop_codon:yes gene_type:complete